MGKPTIKMYYDIVRYPPSIEPRFDASPYAYMGVKILSRYRDYWGDRVDVEFIPFFLGGIMVGASNRPPASVPGNTPLSMGGN
jgi:2-hydroxychromene-2-carboxylate isomerase